MTVQSPGAPTGPDDAPSELAPALLSWAGGGSGHPSAAVVVGARGAGKSRLLAWLVARTSGGAGPTVHAVALAAGQTARTLAWQLGRDLGYGPLEPRKLTQRLAADRRPVLLLVADLHRAGHRPTHCRDNTAEAVLTDLLLPLLALPQVRMAVETDTADLPGLADALVLDLGAARWAVPTAPPSPPGADAPGQDWRSVDPAVRAGALDRALDAGTAPALLADPGYLIHGPVTAITAALADQGLRVPRRLRSVWAAAAPALSDPRLSDHDRAAVLHTASVGRDARLAEFLRPLVQAGPWSTRWSLPDRPANAVTLLPPVAGPQADTAVMADPLGRLVRLALADGRVLERFTPEPPWTPAALVTATADCLLALDRSGPLRPVPVTAAAAVPLAVNRLILRHNAASLLADARRPTAVAVAGRLLAVGDRQGTVHLWRRNDLVSEPVAVRLHEHPVAALACLEAPDSSTALLVTGGLDGTVRLWDSGSGSALAEPVLRRRAVPTALAIAPTPTGLLLVTAWSDRQLLFTLLPSGQQAELPALAPVEALAVTTEGLVLAAGPGGVLCLRTDFFPPAPQTTGHRNGPKSLI